MLNFERKKNKIIFLILAHVCLIEFPTLINWMNPFPIEGLLSSNLQFHLISLSTF